MVPGQLHPFPLTQTNTHLSSIKSTKVSPFFFPEQNPDHQRPTQSLSIHPKQIPSEKEHWKNPVPQRSTINFPQPPSTQRWSSIPPSQNRSQSSRSFNHTSQSNPSSLLLPISHHFNPSSHSPNKNQNHLQPLNREPPEASPTVVFNPYQPSLSFWPSHTENHPVYILQQQLNWIESYKNIIV